MSENEISEIKEKAEDFQDSVEDTAQTLREKATHWQQAAKDNVTKYAKNTNAFVRDNPWTAVGIAAFVAFILGLRLGVRRR